MRGYWAIFKIRVKTLMQYRIPTLAGVVTQLFWGMVLTMIMRAFYAESSSIEPISVNVAVTFIWLGQALLLLLPWNVDKEIEKQIKNGNVAYELLRPLHLYGLWYFRILALRVTPTILRCLPIFLIGGIWLDLSAPASWMSCGAFIISVVLASLLSAAITTLVTLSLFWTHSGEGIQRLLPSCAVLLSGMVVPLPLFPFWMRPFLEIQPFRGLVDIPCRLYTGMIPLEQVPYYFLFQLAWIILFVLWGQRVAKKALRQFVILGG